MRRVRYQVAASLDGFIAAPDGAVDWIPHDPEFDFAALYSQFDTLLMGRRTFEDMKRAGMGGIPGMKSFIFSRTLSQADHPDVQMVGENPQEIVKQLRATPGKDIWVFGGGALFASLAEAGLVDTVEIAVVPVLLGRGTPVAPLTSRLSLKLTGHSIYGTGIVLLEYAVQEPA
jgi:dihydrofolate reductase